MVAAGSRTRKARSMRRISSVRPKTVDAEIALEAAGRLNVDEPDPLRMKLAHKFAFFCSSKSSPTVRLCSAISGYISLILSCKGCFPHDSVP